MDVDAPGERIHAVLVTSSGDESVTSSIDKLDVSSSSKSRIESAAADAIMTSQRDATRRNAPVAGLGGTHPGNLEGGSGLGGGGAGTGGTFPCVGDVVACEVTGIGAGGNQGLGGAVGLSVRVLQPAIIGDRGEMKGGKGAKGKASDGVRAFIPYAHLTDCGASGGASDEAEHANLNLARRLVDTYQVGDVLERTTCFSVGNILIMTAKTLLVDAAERGELVPSFEALEKNRMYVGVIARRNEQYGYFVDLPGNLSGLVPHSAVDNRPYAVGQTVLVRVTHVDLEKRRFSLTLKVSDESQESPVGQKFRQDFLVAHLRDTERLRRHLCGVGVGGGIANSSAGLISAGGGGGLKSPAAKRMFARLQRGDTLDCCHVTDASTNQRLPRAYQRCTIAIDAANKMARSGQEDGSYLHGAIPSDHWLAFSAAGNDTKKRPEEAAANFKAVVLDVDPVLERVVVSPLPWLVKSLRKGGKKAGADGAALDVGAQVRGRPVYTPPGTSYSVVFVANIGMVVGDGNHGAKSWTKCGILAVHPAVEPEQEGGTSQLAVLSGKDSSQHAAELQACVIRKLQQGEPPGGSYDVVLGPAGLLYGPPTAMRGPGAVASGMGGSGGAGKRKRTRTDSMGSNVSESGGIGPLAGGVVKVPKIAVGTAYNARIEAIHELHMDVLIEDYHRGRVHTSEIVDVGDLTNGERPLAMYRPHQHVRVKIIQILTDDDSQADASSGSKVSTTMITKKKKKTPRAKRNAAKMVLCTMKPSKLRPKASNKQANLRPAVSCDPGDKVWVFVRRIADSGLDVLLGSQGTVKGHVDRLRASSNPVVLADLAAHFVVGQAYLGHVLPSDSDVKLAGKKKAKKAKITGPQPTLNISLVGPGTGPGGVQIGQIISTAAFC